MNLNRKISLFVTMLIFCFTLGTITATAQPSIEFKDSKIEIGTIAENEGKVSRDFVFRNTGDTPLVILSASTACSCTKIKYPKNPITANKEGIITVTFDPKNQSGTIYKAINIYCNTPQKRHIIILSGAVGKQ